MAQDFWAAFNLGEEELRINTINADGVALAAIQGLYEIVQEKDAEIAGQRDDIETLAAQNDDFQHRIAALELKIHQLIAWKDNDE